MSRNRLWLTIIASLFIVSFLVGFAPIRVLHEKPGPPPGTFTYTFAQPLYQDPAQKDAATRKLQDLLTKSGVDRKDIAVIRFTSDKPTLIEVSTNATTEAESQQLFGAITAAFQTKYADVAGTMPPAKEEAPLYKFGPFGLFRPMPKVKLGLDLQGGVQVVLQALPESILTFETAPDRPMVAEAPTPVPGAPATPAATTPAAAGWHPTETKDSLLASVESAVRNAGAPQKGLKIDLVAPYRVQVTTRAPNDRELQIEKAAIQKRLESLYPNAEVKANDVSKVFIETGKIGERTADKILDIIDRRLYQMSDIREPITQVQGDDRVIVQVPGVRNPEDVKRLLQQTAMLRFTLIPSRYQSVSKDNYDEWTDTQTSQVVSWQRVSSESSVEFRGSDLKSNASVRPGESGDWVVGFELQDTKKQAFATFTRRNVGRTMAIVLDDKCQMAPRINEEIPNGTGIISGKMQLDEARDLKLLLNAGALPVPLEIVEDRTVSATLGQDSIRQSLFAGLIGLVMIGVFMIGYYRLPGALANIALLLYIMLVLAVIAAPNVLGVAKGIGAVTLTLPGIFGIILSIGMAVDANVIIFERLKEEIWAGKSMRTAVDDGFKRAWTAVLDCNVTTLITASVLYFLGTSAIKSFAVTLFLGVALSLFTAVTVSRWLVTMVANTRWGDRLEMFEVKKDDVRAL